MALQMKDKLLWIVVAFYCPGFLFAQTDSLSIKEEKPLQYKGQLSGWMQYSPDIQNDFWLGGRYIPQLNYKIPFKKTHLVDIELSANIFGDMGAHLFDSVDFDGRIKPHRAWIRYSNSCTEIRLGLQKINFGSAQLFRPLMWFDRMDPRDPVQFTDGVWGLLWRYYFQNNTNIWLWGLHGNKNTKGWEILPTHKQYPEGGGRIQIPIPHGETALSYHFRIADATPLQHAGLATTDGEIRERRLGFDIRLDMTVGLWLEASWTAFNKNIGMYTNQEMITLGTDYTFGIGDGLTATFEQLIFSYDEKAFRFANATTFSGLLLSYPIGLSDNLSAIIYHDWTNGNPYFFINWQKQLDHIAFHVMGYWNPKTYNLPGQGLESNRFAGKGLKLMVVWNH